MPSIRFWGKVHRPALSCDAAPTGRMFNEAVRRWEMRCSPTANMQGCAQLIHANRAETLSLTAVQACEAAGVDLCTWDSSLCCPASKCQATANSTKLAIATSVDEAVRMLSLSRTPTPTGQEHLCTSVSAADTATDLFAMAEPWPCYCRLNAPWSDSLAWYLCHAAALSSRGAKAAS